MPGKTNTVADALLRSMPVVAVSQTANSSLSELCTGQRAHSLWSSVIYVLESGDESALPKLSVPFDNFSSQDDVLCRTVTISEDVVTQLVILVVFVDILQLLHDAPSAGHPGHDRTLATARSNYYWHTIHTDIE